MHFLARGVKSVNKLPCDCFLSKYKFNRDNSLFWRFNLNFTPENAVNEKENYFNPYSIFFKFSTALL